MSESPTGSQPTRKFAASVRTGTTAAQLRAKAAVEIREKQSSDDVRTPQSKKKKKKKNLQFFSSFFLYIY